MKKILLFIGILLFQWAYWYQEHIVEKIDGKNVNYIKVILDWKHKIITSLAQDWDHLTKIANWDTLENLVNKVGWVSGVNGAYFCPADYKQCWGINYSDNSRYFEGESYSRYGTDLGSSWLFGFDKNWDPLFILNNYGYVDGINRKINQDKLTQVQYGIANFPVLVVNGENVINESSAILESKQTARGIKSFICSESDNITINMWTVDNVTVQELAEFVQTNLNCYNAINLDSWGSLGMVYNHENIKKPGRKIMDAFVVVETNETQIPEKIIVVEAKKPSKLAWIAFKKIDSLLEKKPEMQEKLLIKIQKIKSKLKKFSKNYNLITEIEEYLKTK